MGPWRNWVDSVSAQLAFFPPRPSTYEVREHNDGSGELYIQPLLHGMPRIPVCSVLKLKTTKTKVGGWGGGDEIVTAFMQYPNPKGPSSAQTSSMRLTLLYSHGNAVDLGQMLPVYREISKLLKVNVMGYDYTGYGASSGEPTMGKTFSDISAVYDCLVNHYNIPPMSIILYGQSVGSGPSAWLGAHTKGLGGVVLHSPLLSGIRVLSPNIKWWPAFADVFTNHVFMPKIQAPVLIMHGTQDEVINISCGQKLASLIKPKYRFPPLWAEGFNHQNVEQCPQYLPHLQAFIAHCIARAQADADEQRSSAGCMESCIGGEAAPLPVSTLRTASFVPSDSQRSSPR